MVQAAESDLAELETLLADPNTYSLANAKGGSDIPALTRAREQAEQRVAKLTDRWEELETKKAVLQDR